SLIESGARCEAAKDLCHAMDSPGDHGGGEVVRAGDYVCNDFGVLGIGYARFEHANDSRSAVAEAAQPHRFADNRAGLLERAGPETIRENNYAGGFSPIILRADETAENRMESHHIEIGTADDAGIHFPRLPQADHGKADGRKLTERAQTFDVR